MAQMGKTPGSNEVMEEEIKKLRHSTRTSPAAPGPAPGLALALAPAPASVPASAPAPGPAPVPAPGSGAETLLPPPAPPAQPDRATAVFVSPSTPISQLPCFTAILGAPPALDLSRVYTPDNRSCAVGSRLELILRLHPILEKLEPVSTDFLSVCEEAETRARGSRGVGSARFRQKEAKAMIVTHVVDRLRHHGVLLASENCVLLHGALEVGPDLPNLQPTAAVAGSENWQQSAAAAAGSEKDLERGEVGRPAGGVGPTSGATAAAGGESVEEKEESKDDRDLVRLVTAQQHGPEEKDAATEMPEPRSASPAQRPPRLPKRAIAVFLYSVVLTVLSVHNAGVTGSFALSSKEPLEPSNRVFAVSAVMEASGLAFGVCMSMFMYIDKANERGLWSDMLSEPCLIALEGMIGEGERGRTLFRVGLNGSGCQSFFAIFTLFVMAWLREDVLAKIVVAGFFASSLLLIMSTRIFMRKRIADTTLLVVVTHHVLGVTILFEALEAYYLSLAELSLRNITLVVLDALAIAPLGVAALGILAISPSLPLIFGSTETGCGCRPTCRREDVGPANPSRFESFILRRLERSNVLEP